MLFGLQGIFHCNTLSAHREKLEARLSGDAISSSHNTSMVQFCVCQVTVSRFKVQVLIYLPFYNTGLHGKIKVVVTAKLKL